jgi:hypothetical protein
LLFKEIIKKIWVGASVKKTKHFQKLQRWKTRPKEVIKPQTRPWLKLLNRSDSDCCASGGPPVKKTKHLQKLQRWKTRPNLRKLLNRSDSDCCASGGPPVKKTKHLQKLQRWKTRPVCHGL